MLRRENEGGRDSDIVLVGVCETRSVLPRLFRPVGRSVVRGTLSREQRSCVRASVEGTLEKNEPERTTERRNVVANYNNGIGGDGNCGNGQINRLRLSR